MELTQQQELAARRAAQEAKAWAAEASLEARMAQAEAKQQQQQQQQQQQMGGTVDAAIEQRACSEPASARAGYHALLRTGSMAAAASQSMSAAEFYNHLVDTGWLTFLNAPHVFEAGDDMPADILMGTEMEGATLELLSNEIRYTARHENGDVVVQVEVKNFFGSWTAVLGAASYNNDEVRLLPNIHSATGDAICLRARLEPDAARQQVDAGKRQNCHPPSEPRNTAAESPNSAAGIATPTAERGGMFVWQETELTVELNQAAACLGICQLQRYIVRSSVSHAPASNPD
eukprot:COSAG02_NODE_18624_length_929_cov_0.854217_1_plen_288_part_01